MRILLLALPLAGCSVVNYSHSARAQAIGHEQYEILSTANAEDSDHLKQALLAKAREACAAEGKGFRVVNKNLVPTEDWTRSTKLPAEQGPERHYDFPGGSMIVHCEGLPES